MKRFLIMFIGILGLFMFAVPGAWAGAYDFTIEPESGVTPPIYTDTQLCFNQRTGEYTVEPLMTQRGYISAQIDEIIMESGATPSGTTFTVVMKVSNVDDAHHWSGASEVTIWSGLAVSGTTYYIVSPTIQLGKYVRFWLRLYEYTFKTWRASIVLQ